MMKVKMLSLVCLGVFLLGSVAVSTGETQDIVRAKIGIRIQAGDQERWAKTRERARVGERFRLYVLPESDGYIYVLYTDKETVIPVDEVQRINVSEGEYPVFVLPSMEDLYEFDGKNRSECLIIVWSLEEPVDIESLFNSQDVSYAQWRKREEELMAKSKIDLTGEAEKPWEIAAAVRGQEQQLYDWLQEELPILSGKSLVLKTYEFRVKK
jgi:hypothetical protein